MFSFLLPAADRKLFVAISPMQKTELFNDLTIIYYFLYLVVTLEFQIFSFFLIICVIFLTSTETVLRVLILQEALVSVKHELSFSQIPI